MKARSLCLTLVAGSSILLMACGDDGVTPVDTGGELVVIAAAGAAAPATAGPQAVGPQQAPIGAPSSMLIGLYEFQITMNSDCSGPFVSAFNSGGSPVVHDFVTSPELFRVDGLPTGTYPCVAMRISDILEFQSAVSGGACATGTTYRGDVYRAGGEDEPFLDLGLGVITATGTDAVPSEDGIYILFTTNPTATTARGFAQNQVVQLTSAMVVPDVVTFRWDASNAVDDAGTACKLEPDAPALFW